MSRGWGNPKSPRRVVSYSACRHCDAWSLGVQANGKFVRHTAGFGYVEKAKRLSRWFRPGPICEGSGELADPSYVGNPRR